MSERWFLFVRDGIAIPLLHPEEHLPPSRSPWRCVAAGTREAMEAAIRLFNT